MFQSSHSTRCVPNISESRRARRVIIAKKVINDYRPLSARLIFPVCLPIAFNVSPQISAAIPVRFLIYVRAVISSFNISRIYSLFFLSLANDFYDLLFFFI